jgi:hypothetical protein
LEGDAV